MYEENVIQLILKITIYIRIINKLYKENSKINCFLHKCRKMSIVVLAPSGMIMMQEILYLNILEKLSISQVQLNRNNDNFFHIRYSTNNVSPSDTHGDYVCHAISKANKN